MLLQKISLENFRQFDTGTIEFSTDPDKNVTIIMGDNGSGKTTFAQAFHWCLYGETSFSDKNILNKQTAKEMLPGQIATVKVTLELTHGSARYQITRTQDYKKLTSNSVSGANAVLNIAITTSDGNTRWLSPNECEVEVKKILPKELAGYFFFDGERIDKMSKEIAAGHKSSGFKDAVVGLTGLRGLASAKDHLSPTKSASVFGLLNNEYTGESRKKIEELTREINSFQDEIEGINSRIEELDDEISAARDTKAKAEEEIKQYSDGAKLQTEKEKLEKDIENAKTLKARFVKEVAKDFNREFTSFISLSLSKKALNILAHSDYRGKDIPKLEGDTVQFLLDRGICICGTRLDPGSPSYLNLEKLKEYIPPNSISSMLGNYIKDTRQRYVNAEDLLKAVSDNFASISEKEDEISEVEDKLTTLKQRIEGDDVKSAVATLGKKINSCEGIIRDGQSEKDEKLKRKGACETEIKNRETERKEYSLLDENNKKIDLNKAYALTIYNQLSSDYSEKETKVRENLEQMINEIFKFIYNGGLSLEIDEKYNIKVNVINYEGAVETSTAQSISVIFAFISAIIKMARDSKAKGDETYAEPYPLVMDAPLSAFDKRRIKTICEAIPKTAEQVVIFIKDTDGELAEEQLGTKVGQRHSLKKIDEFHTELS